MQKKTLKQLETESGWLPAGKLGILRLHTPPHVDTLGHRGLLFLTVRVSHRPRITRRS